MLRLRGWDDPKAAAPWTRIRPARARLKRKFKAEAAAPASGKACDWLAPHVPSAISQDSSLDPRSFRGHSFLLGHVFDGGGRALDRRIVCCAKCGALYWERANALCRTCKQHPGGCASQLRKLKSGFFPSNGIQAGLWSTCGDPPWTRRTRWWRSWNLARQAWDAQSWGRQPPRKHASPHRQQSCCTGDETLGQPRPRNRTCGAGRTTARATWLHFGSTLSWWKSSPPRLGVLVLARQTDIAATHTRFSRVSQNAAQASSARCAWGCDASSSSDDEPPPPPPPNIWNALLEATLHACVERCCSHCSRKVALSCRFASDALCAELYALHGDRALHSVGSFSGSDGQERGTLGNPLLAALSLWQRGRSACAIGNEELSRARSTCRFAAGFLSEDRPEPAA